MPTARSYDNYEIQGDPFEENGRMYVNVLTPKGIKQVRWYTEAERAAQDRKAGIEVKKNDLMDFNARHAFGFGELGFITIYKTVSAELLENFVESNHESFRYNLTFQYYTPSRLPIPTLPDGIIPIQLKWEDVQDYDTRMRSHEEITRLVNRLLGLGTTTTYSTYQGEEGEWLEKEVTIRENITHENHFGEKHTHFMCDAEGNTYIWETGTKNFEANLVVKLKMKVKAHKEINGEQCTIVWYCKEI